MIEIVESYCANNLITFGSSPSPLNVNPKLPEGVTFEDADFNDNLTVEATFDYDFLLVSNLIPGLPNSITLGAESVMKYE